MSDWTRALDCYEAALDAHEATVRSAGDIASARSPWPAPGWPDGGVPEEHRARAQALLARTADLASRAALIHQNLPPLPVTSRRRGTYPTSAIPTQVDRSV